MEWILAIYTVATLSIRKILESDFKDKISADEQEYSKISLLF
jgi:hypothetical protein